MKMGWLNIFDLFIFIKSHSLVHNYFIQTPQIWEFVLFLCLLKCYNWCDHLWGLSSDHSLISAGGDSSQDEAEEEAKAITVKKKTTCIQTLTFNTDFVRRCKLTISKHSCYPPGEVCSSWVGAGSAEEDPVVWVPPEEAGGGALGSPTLPRCQGTLIRINTQIVVLISVMQLYFLIIMPSFCRLSQSSSLIQLMLSHNVLLLYICP